MEKKHWASSLIMSEEMKQIEKGVVRDAWSAPPSCLQPLLTPRRPTHHWGTPHTCHSPQVHQMPLDFLSDSPDSRIHLLTCSRFPDHPHLLAHLPLIISAVLRCMRPARWLFLLLCHFLTLSTCFQPSVPAISYLCFDPPRPSLLVVWTASWLYACSFELWSAFPPTCSASVSAFGSSILLPHTHICDCLTQDLNAEAHYHPLYNALSTDPCRLPCRTVFSYAWERYLKR